MGIRSNSRCRSSRPTSNGLSGESLQKGDAKEAPARQCTPDMTSSGRRRTRPAHTRNQKSETPCHDPGAEAEDTEKPEKRVDLLLAAAIAAERKPGAGGRKPGAKMLRRLKENSSLVCQDETTEKEVRANASASMNRVLDVRNRLQKFISCPKETAELTVESLY